MKGGIGRVALGIGMLAAIAPAALAQARSTFTQTFIDWLNFILVEATSKGEATFLLYIKFILFVIIFAAIFFGAGKVFTDDKQRKIRVAISLSISLLAIVGLPDVLVRSLVVTYGVIAGALLSLLPIYAVYLIGKSIGEGSFGANALRAALYVIMGILLTYFGMQIASVGTGGFDVMTGQSAVDAAEVWSSIGGWLEFGAVLCFLAAAWQLFSAFSNARANGAGGGSGPNPSPGPAVPADIEGQLRRALEPLIGNIQALARQLEDSLAARDRSVQQLETKLVALIDSLKGQRDQDSQDRQAFLQSILKLIERSNQQAGDAQKAIADLLAKLPDALKRDNEQLLKQIAEKFGTDIKSSVELAIKSLQDAISQFRTVAPPAATNPALVALQPAYTILPAIPGEANVINQQIGQVEQAHRRVAAGGPPVIVKINNKNYIIGRGLQPGTAPPSAPAQQQSPTSNARKPNALDIRRALFERIIHQLRITVPDKASVIASIKISKKARTSAAELDEYMIETIHALRLTNEQKRALINVGANEAEYEVIGHWLS